MMIRWTIPVGEIVTEDVDGVDDADEEEDGMDVDEIWAEDTVLTFGVTNKPETDEEDVGVKDAKQLGPAEMEDPGESEYEKESDGDNQDLVDDLDLEETVRYMYEVKDEKNASNNCGKDR